MNILTIVDYCCVYT